MVHFAFVANYGTTVSSRRTTPPTLAVSLHQACLSRILTFSTFVRFVHNPKSLLEATLRESGIAMPANLLRTSGQTYLISCQHHEMLFSL